MTGDYQGAIEDFQYYVEHRGFVERVQKRRAWIEKLQAGMNPFDAAMLEALKTE